MPHKLTWSDRLRIERVVWMLDQRLYDIPRESRIAHRREVRLNLLSAAHDIGTRAALQNIGTSAQLADAYRAAEFGDRPRHSWIAAGVWAATSMLVVTAVLTDAANGFAGCIPGIHEVLVQQGILAGRWCLDPDEDLSPGQGEEIARVCKDFDDLPDDNFVKEHLHEWLK